MISVSVLTAVVQKNRRMMSSRNAAVVIARKSTPEGGYPLFDHLAGAGDQRLRNFERERLRSLSLPAAPRLNFDDYRAADLGRHQVCGTRTAQNRSTASATALATVALRAGDESTCSSARLTIIPASKSTAGICDSYSTARLS